MNVLCVRSLKYLQKACRRHVGDSGDVLQRDVLLVVDGDVFENLVHPLDLLFVEDVVESVGGEDGVLLGREPLQQFEQRHAPVELLHVEHGFHLLADARRFAVLEAESQLRFFQQLVDLGEGRQFEKPRAENAFREVDHHLIVGVGPDGRAPFVYQPVVGQVRPQQQDFHAADAAEMASDVLDAVVHADEHQHRIRGGYATGHGRCKKTLS